MKWPSRRNRRPNGTLSWTSTSWHRDRKRSKRSAERMKKPHSSVRCSVMRSGARSCADVSDGVSGILATATNRVEVRALGLQHLLERAKQCLGLGRVVRLIIADVHVDRHEPVLGPRVDRKMRFGEQHRPGDALRLELMKAVPHPRETRLEAGFEARLAQRFSARELRRARKAAVPFA